MSVSVSRWTTRLLAVCAVLAFGGAGQAHAQVRVVRLVNLECVRPLEKDGDRLLMNVFTGRVLYFWQEVAPMRARQVLTLDRNVSVTGRPWFRLIRQVPGTEGQLINWFELKNKPGLQTADLKWKGAHYRLQYEWVR
jgi:hypothetical protein